MTFLDKIHKHKFLIVAILFLFLTGIALVPLTHGWLFNGYDDPEFEAHAISSYFESGSGAENDPYVISNAYHFYNMSWLINLGKIPADSHFELKEGIGEIDIAGQLDGTMGRSGAIPPIGTSSQPFTGSFNGNGVVIKNLWVSTDPADWYEQPGQYTSYDLGTDVGLFGNVGYGADISNFYLENIEVTTTTSNATLGILAGYVDGNMSNIGVKNAKLSFKNGSETTVSSGYSLVGETSKYVSWDDLPSIEEGGSGDLIIDPNNIKYRNDEGENRNNIFSSVRDVDDSVLGHAYYVPGLSITEPRPVPTALYKYTTTVSFHDQKVNGKQYVLHHAENPTLISTQAQQEEYNVDKALFDIVKGGANYAIDTSGAVNFTSLQSYTEQSLGLSLALPKNCIWFNPIVPGECTVAFTRQNNSGDNIMSIYRYKRSGNSIDQSTIEEIILSIPPMGNGLVVCFSLHIDEDDLGYEYVIGQSSEKLDKKDSDAAFVYLKLAGTDTSGDVPVPDGETVRKLFDIDFVQSTDVDLTLDTVPMHKSVIAIAGTQTADGALYYNVNANNVVIYYDGASGLTLTEKVRDNPESDDVDYSETAFPPREDTLPETPTQ